ncbi:MAG: hypothetical protein HW387_1052 [Parachlamydiales bacterium]|nr:hypothetical protein [Parachlamydiales bacterium]
MDNVAKNLRRAHRLQKLIEPRNIVIRRGTVTDASHNPIIDTLTENDLQVSRSFGNIVGLYHKTLMSRLFHWIFLSFSAASLSAAPLADYAIMGDIDFSPFAGSENLLYGTRLIERGEECFFRKATFDNPKSSIARSLRLTELLTIYMPLNYEAMLIQHEVFGHGYRIRSLGNSIAYVSGYDLGVPLPYGYGGGATKYHFNPSRLTSSEEMAISMAGVESTAIMANVTKWKWLTTRMIDAKQSLLYIWCQSDISEYISSLKTIGKYDDGEMEGHDIHEYLAWLNRTYPQKHLSGKRLIALNWINLLDPFAYYSIWAWFHYISSGRDTKIPMIKIGNVGYLCSARLGLTPFGPEVFWENYFANQGRVYYAYIKGGRHAGNRYVGAGVFLPVLYKRGKWEMGLRCDLWRQPKMLLSPGSLPLDEAMDYPLVPLYAPALFHRMHFGAALSITAFYHWNQRFGVEGEFGAKSNGYLPGNSLWGGGIARVGLSTRF